MGIEVTDNADESRFEIHSDGRLAGYAEYQLIKGDRILFPHTEVDPAFGGQGLGGELVAGALDAAIERGLAIIPLCPFVARHVQQHPELLPHLDERIRKAFA
ncbi:MAG: N-acetyltransferase [Solirubrobacteraceae bacterium]|nr:N-acetyltransferase [Solirubrobacteraceae bacterium]